MTSQLDFIHLCLYIYYIIKKRGRYKYKLWGHKPNPANPHKGVGRPKQIIQKIKTTQVGQPLINPKTNQRFCVYM